MVSWITEKMSLDGLIRVQTSKSKNNFLKPICLSRVPMFSYWARGGVYPRQADQCIRVQHIGHRTNIHASKQLFLNCWREPRYQ